MKRHLDLLRKVDKASDVLLKRVSRLVEVNGATLIKPHQQKRYTTQLMKAATDVSKLQQRTYRISYLYQQKEQGKEEQGKKNLEKTTSSSEKQDIKKKEDDISKADLKVHEQLIYEEGTAEDAAIDMYAKRTWKDVAFKLYLAICLIIIGCWSFVTWLATGFTNQYIPFMEGTFSDPVKGPNKVMDLVNKAMFEVFPILKGENTEYSESGLVQHPEFQAILKEVFGSNPNLRLINGNFLMNLEHSMEYFPMVSFPKDTKNIFLWFKNEMKRFRANYHETMMHVRLPLIDIHTGRIALLDFQFQTDYDHYYRGRQFVQMNESDMFDYSKLEKLYLIMPLTKEDSLPEAPVEKYTPPKSKLADVYTPRFKDDKKEGEELLRHQKWWYRIYDAWFGTERDLLEQIEAEGVQELNLSEEEAQKQQEEDEYDTRYVTSKEKERERREIRKTEKQTEQKRKRSYMDPSFSLIRVSLEDAQPYLYKYPALFSFSQLRITPVTSSIQWPFEKFENVSILESERQVIAKPLISFLSASEMPTQTKLGAITLDKAPADWIIPYCKAPKLNPFWQQHYQREIQKKQAPIDWDIAFEEFCAQHQLV